MDIYKSRTETCRYPRLSVTEQSSKLLGLESDLKTYVFRRVPFGLSCSPFWYQKLMNKLLHGYMYIFCASYIDDIVAWSRDWSTHLHHLRLIFDRILNSGLRLRAEKCSFGKTSLKYLGFVISHDCIKPDPDKLDVIKNAKAPTNAKMLRSYLGMTSFFRRFIRGYSKICQPFRNLLKKKCNV